MATMDGENYIHKLKDADSFNMWDFEIKILLKAKDLMDVIDGTETLEQQGESADKIKIFKNKDAKAQHYILLTIDNDVKIHIISCNSAKEMYDTLKNLFKRDTIQQKCALLQDFYTCKFSTDKDMMGNLTYIQNIAYKLNRLDQKIDETMVITKILSVLPEQYKHFSSAWDSTANTEKTLDNLKARLLQEETKWAGSLPLVASQKHPPSKEKQLQSVLFQNYDPFQSPDRGNRTEVKLGILLGTYDYNERVGEVAIQGFIRMSWNDKRLTWNATEKGVDIFAPDEHDIWRPHITEIRDRGFDGEPIYHPHGKTGKIRPQNVQSTVVRSDGDITSVHTFRLTAKCTANLMNWPRDTATCEGFVGSEAIQNLNLTTYHADGYMFPSYIEPDMEDWLLLNTSDTKLDLEPPKNGFDQIINITLELGTTGNIFTRLLIFPGIGSLVITLAMLVLKFDNNIRLFTLGISFIIHTYLLQILAFHMPPCGSQPPYLVKYFANSLIITGLIVVETIAVKSISTLKQMSKLADTFLRYLEICKIFELLLIPRKQISNGNLHGDLNQGESTTKIIIEEKSWETIAFLLDRLMLFTVILAYFYNIVHFLVF